jgi:two-component system, response regulator
MTRRPRTVSSPGVPGRVGAPLVPTVLLADADATAREMVRDALLEGTGPCDLRAVADATELAEYLHRRGTFEDPVISPRPSLILIDNDLPNQGGLDTVRAMKSNAALRRIPVVLIARRADAELVDAAYDAGVNTLLQKPVTFLALVKLMKVFTAYWLDAALLPQEAD